MRIGGFRVVWIIMIYILCALPEAGHAQTGIKPRTAPLEYGSPPRPVAMPENLGGHFRMFIWGVGPEDVQRFETAVFDRAGENTLEYIELPSKNDFMRNIRYEFEEGKLIRAQYNFFEINDSNQNTVPAIYADFKDALSRIYGPITNDEAVWLKTSPYKNHPQFWGRAIFMKALKLRATWETPDSIIVLENYFIGPHYYLGYTAQSRDAAQDRPARNPFNS